MNGLNPIAGGSAAVGANPGPSWKVVGSGDFNGDGHSDILWQNASGQAAIWEMNGLNPIAGGSAAVGANPGPSWKAVGTGDFNGDGHSDILWQNARRSGRDLGDEREQPDRWRQRRVGAIPARAWKAIGTGDFNGDGYSDILWQNTSGQAAIWEMNGTNLDRRRQRRSRPNPGPTWKAIGPATSTATASPTSCGRTPAARRRSGRWTG